MQYVAQQTSIEVGAIDIVVLIKVMNPTDNPSSSDIMTISKPIVGDPSKVEIRMVEEHQTLGEIQETFGLNQRNLVSSLQDSMHYFRNMSTILYLNSLMDDYIKLSIKQHTGPESTFFH